MKFVVDWDAVLVEYAGIAFGLKNGGCMKLLAVLFVAVWASSALAEVDASMRVADPDSLIYAIVKAENPWLDAKKVGDRNLYHKAFGLLQVRKPYLDDVNRIVGRKDMMRMWGKQRLTTEDMKDKAKAVWATKVYLTYYGKVYEDETGKKVTPEVYARIHNGGPSGWKKWVTKSYWHKVRSRMAESFLAENVSEDADTVTWKKAG